MRINVLFISLLPLLLSSSIAIAQPDYLSNNADLPGHPRILMLKGEEAAIKTSLRDNTWNKVHQSIIEDCERLLTVEPVKRIQVGRRLLGKSREALRRIFFLSYAYRLTEE